MQKVLPHVLKKGMSQDALIKAIRENFEALAGQTGQLKVLYASVSGGGSSAAQADAEDKASSYAGTFVDNLIEDLEAAGVGPEDGDPPAGVPANVQAIGGIGNWFIVLWDTIENTSGVTYEIHVSTSTGFTPAANTRVGTWSNPGQSGGKGTFTVREFPTGHALAGTPIAAGTTYYVKVVATDGDGAGTPSSQASTTPITVDADSIIAAGTIVANLIAGTTITGDKIAGTTITADKLNVGTLSAITANLGTITAGSLEAVTITGATIKSTNGTTYVTISSALGAWVDFVVSGSHAGHINAAAGVLTLASANSVARIEVRDGTVTIPNNTTLEVSDPIKYTDSNDTATNPSVSAGGGQALPGDPTVWFKIITPAGVTRYFPAW